MIRFCKDYIKGWFGFALYFLGSCGSSSSSGFGLEEPSFALLSRAVTWRPEELLYAIQALLLDGFAFRYHVPGFSTWDGRGMGRGWEIIQFRDDVLLFMMKPSARV